MDDRLWYAAYGSNLDRDRFLCYLTGGLPPGGMRVYRGCRDRRPPRADIPATLPFPLRFAGVSATWGGGTAFLEPDAHPARSWDGGRPAPVDENRAVHGIDATHMSAERTYARLYLLARGQLEDVIAQENDAPSAPLPAVGAGLPRWFIAGPGKYGVVLHCGVRIGRPVVTVTAPPHQPRPRVAAPSAAYLRTIARGLKAAHRLSPAAIADYLVSKPGVALGWSRNELASLASEP